jgi:uncharacterized protein (DUF302 family)
MYSFATQLKGNLWDVVYKLTTALKAEGFSILDEIGDQAPIKDNPGKGNKVYKVLTACNPILPKRNPGTGHKTGFLLPCNVEMQELQDSLVKITFMVPNTILNLLWREDISSLREEALNRLLRVCQLLDEPTINRSYTNSLDLCVPHRF